MVAGEVSVAPPFAVFMFGIISREDVTLVPAMLTFAWLIRRLWQEAYCTERPGKDARTEGWHCGAQAALVQVPSKS